MNDVELKKILREHFHDYHNYCEREISKYIHNDYTKESIKEIELKIAEYKNSKELDSNQESLMIHVFGVYLGDVILSKTKKYGYDWHVSNEYSDEKIKILLAGSDYPFLANKEANSFYFPIDKISKCYYNDEEENGDKDLIGFYNMVVSDSIGVHDESKDAPFEPEEVNRDDLIDELLECEKNKPNDIKEYAREIIQIIKKRFQLHIFHPDSRFLILGRKKVLLDEFNMLFHNTSVLTDEQLYFAIGNLLEFISNHNMLNPAECEELGMDFIKTRTENDQYYLDKIICLEEKRCIIDMVFQIEKQVKE